MDSDLRQFGDSVLPSSLSDAGVKIGNIILQVQKVKNVAAPKIQQNSNPKLILATVTDGKVNQYLVHTIYMY